MRRRSRNLYVVRLKRAIFDAFKNFVKLTEFCMYRLKCCENQLNILYMYYCFEQKYREINGFTSFTKLSTVCILSISRNIHRFFTHRSTERGKHIEEIKGICSHTILAKIS